MRLTRRSPGILFLSLVLLAILMIFLYGQGAAQTSPGQYDQTLTRMLDAIQSRSYDKFVAEGEAWFKDNFKPKMFDDLAQQLGPKLQQGYTLTFLTTLNRQNHVGYVWKLAVKGNKEDYIATLFIKEGLVSGFVVR